MSSEFVASGGEDKIRFTESVDRVSPNGDLGFTPGDTDFGMMINGLGQLSHSVGEIKRFLEVSEFEDLLQVVFVDDLPIVLKLAVDGV